MGHDDLTRADAPGLHAARTQASGSDRLPQGAAFPSDSLARRFKTIRLLGQGGMGAVLLAWDEQLSRQVALKKLLGAGEPSDAARQRFVAEAKAMASLQHPNLLPLHELLEDDDGLTLVMDYVEGTSLADRLEGGPLTPDEAIRVALDLAEALDHAHGAGVLHRDVKPANVMFDAEERVLLLDFGVAKRLDGSVALTQTGHVVGTPQYMAPEQVQDSKRVDARSDVYGLGATLFHMLTGREVFPTPDIYQLMHQLLEVAPPNPRSLNPAVPRDLAAVCLKSLEKDPAARYPDARAFADDLIAVREGHRPVAATSRRPLHLLAAVCASLLLVVALAAAQRGGDGDPGPPPAPSSLEPSGGPAPSPSPALPRPKAQPLVIQEMGVQAVAFVGAKADQVALACRDRAFLWDVSGEAPRQVWKRSGTSGVALSPSPSGEQLAFVQAGDIFLVEASGELIAHRQVERQMLTCLFLDDSRLLVGEEPLGLTQLEPTRALKSITLRETPHPIQSLAVDHRTGHLAVAAGSSKRDAHRTLDIVRITDPQESVDWWTLSARAVCVIPGSSPGQWILGLANGWIHVLDEGAAGWRPGDLTPAETGLQAPQETLPTPQLGVLSAAHASPVVSLGLLGSGELLSLSSGKASRGFPGDLRVWDLSTNALVGTALQLRAEGQGLAVSRDGRWVAVADESQVVVYPAEHLVFLARGE